MGFVKSAIEGGEGSAESGFAAVLCEGLKSDEIKSQRHSAKELSWLCGDDNRHLGMTGGVINANRLAVIECGGLEILVPLLNGGDPKTAGESHGLCYAPARPLQLCATSLRQAQPRRSGFCR
jgi:hypothetical protein